MPRDTNEVEALLLANDAAIPREGVLALVHERAEHDVGEPRLLDQLAAKSLLVGLALVDAAARSSPTSCRR